MRSPPPLCIPFALESATSSNPFALGSNTDNTALAAVRKDSQSDSDTNLLYMHNDDDDSVEEEPESLSDAESETKAKKVRHLVLKRKQKVERYGGLRRRDSFNRSRKMLSDNLDKMKAKKTSVFARGSRRKGRLSPKEREEKAG